MKNKSLKIVTTILISLFGMLILGTSFAADFEIYGGEVVLSGGRFKPQWIQGHGTMFCIWGHGSYKANMDRSAAKEGTIDGAYRGCSWKQPQWYGDKISMEYTKGDKIPIEDFQDGAYVLAFGRKRVDGEQTEDGSIVKGEWVYDMRSAKALWSSSLNFGVKDAPNDLGKEAAAYKAFYQLIHSQNEKTDIDDIDKNGMEQDFSDYPGPDNTNTIARITNSLFNEQDIKSGIIGRTTYIERIIEQVKKEWKENWEVDLTQDEINATRDEANKYYNKNFKLEDGTYPEENMGANGYPLPTDKLIEQYSQRYKDLIESGGRYYNEEDYKSDMNFRLFTSWKINYSNFKGFTEDETNYINNKLSAYYNDEKNGIKYNGALPSDSDIKTYSQGVSTKSEDEFVTQVYSALQMRWSTKYAMTFNDEQKATIEANIRNYYQTNFGSTTTPVAMLEYKSQYTTNFVAYNSSNIKVQKMRYTDSSNIDDDMAEIIDKNGRDIMNYLDEELYEENPKKAITKAANAFALEVVSDFESEYGGVGVSIKITIRTKAIAQAKKDLKANGYTENGFLVNPGTPGEGEEPGDNGEGFEAYDSPNFDEYYNNYDYEDDRYYDEDQDYKIPGMEEIDRVAKAQKDFYNKEYDEKRQTEKWNPNLKREDFTWRVVEVLESELWYAKKKEYTANELDDIKIMTERYYDKYVAGNQEFKREDYVTDESDLQSVHEIVQEKGYDKITDRNTFIDKVSTDLVNKWSMENNTPGIAHQDKYKQLAAEYYDRYLAKGKEFGDGYKDKFEEMIEDRTSSEKLKVRVQRSDTTYVVGPFNVTYPNGSYEGNNQFSWIKNVRVNDQDGKEIANVVDGTLEVIDKNGNKIMDTVVYLDKDKMPTYGKTLNVPQNGKDFYLKFHSNTAVDIETIIDFNYLESIDVDADRYEGHFNYWYWVRELTGEEHGWTEYCGGDDCNGHWVHCCDYFNYVLKKRSGPTSQLLMQVNSAEPIYKEINYVLLNRERYDSSTPGKPGKPRKVLDMTMDIEGRVFLDRDEGKTNTGNDTYDSGEQLAGVDVWLYNKTDNNKLMGVTITDSDGKYIFKRLNAQKEYYVQFTYNGMLYTNVAYTAEGENKSKATEEAQNHASNRTDFNNLFKEIGSYPENYTTKDCITGATIKNKAYKQDEIVELFKEVAIAMKDKGLYVPDETSNFSEEEVKKEAYQEVINKNSSVAEIKEKVQFIADIRMNAYTVTNYSRYNSFEIDRETEKIGNTTYTHIYYEQRYVNLGIKARPTFDLALYKDVMKAEVKMNGKSETYTYDKRTSNGNGFSIGVSEADYLNGIRGNYIRSVPYDNADKRRQVETDTYDLNMRTEEVANGQSSNYNLDVTGKVNKNYALNENYTNLDKNNGTNKSDRLEIDVTYKISIRNQSGIVGAITEIVDYYDSNYTFIRAYEGDKYGKEIGSVTKYDTSMYGNGTHYENNSKYKTMYLRPNNENRLHNDNKEQYIYVVLRLLGPENVNDAGNLLSQKLLNNDVLTVTNLAEINGYKTYDGTSGTTTPGLIDIDSNPGNLDLRNVSEFTADEIKKHEDRYEDDTSKAPALIYKLLESRTIEGTVFEDETGKDNKVYTGEERKGNGLFDKNEKGIQDVIVQLVEIKNGEMFVRSTTRTNADGWYGFVGFLPGNYTIRYIYGADDATAMTTNSKWIKGSNEHSYNGQDYQSTIFGIKSVQNQDNKYKTDINKNSLYERYKTNYDNRNPEETPELIAFDANTTIKKYNDGYYWYDSDKDTRTSDARDDEYRRQQVISYAREEYVPKETTYDRTAMANHKAEVFNSYLPEQPDHITQELNRELASELERRNYRFAYTAEMPIEVEYVVQTIAGTGRGYEHKITNVDFGIVERPKTKVELTKNVEHIKVTTTDGIVLFDTNKTVENLSWRPKNDRYKAQPPIQIIMDDELISGATIEVTYKITVTNNGELGESLADGENGTATTTMRRILDYVDNSLNFNEEDNLDTNGVPLWKVVTVDDMQNTSNATFINNSPGANNLKLIDLSTQQTLLQTTPNNPLSKALAVGKTAESQVVLRKVIAAESDTEQLTYNNIMETIEIDNEVGRYDHESVPGNQDPEKEPEEDDTYKSEIVTILPPFGQRARYLIIGISMFAVVLLGVGVFIIKKYVVDKK